MPIVRITLEDVELQTFDELMNLLIPRVFNWSEYPVNYGIDRYEYGSTGIAYVVSSGKMMMLFSVATMQASRHRLNVELHEPGKKPVYMPRLAALFNEYWPGQQTPRDTPTDIPMVVQILMGRDRVGGWVKTDQAGPDITSQGPDSSPDGQGQADEEGVATGDQAGPVDFGFTPRQMEVAHLVAQGLTSKEIGEKLVISLHTVDAHRKQITSKLDVPVAQNELSRILKQARYGQSTPQGGRGQ